MRETKAPGSAVIGGGPKKILYTLKTARRIGLLNSAKALSSHNACKACGLGMGGQLGGMTNELGEFPAVCNKSIQTQSTDIQPPIPLEIFNHSLEEFKQLSGREMETLGRLDTPLFKARGSEHYRPVEWDWALNHAAARFSEVEPERSFFYSSGRSSNEAGFILQLLARLFGTNNVNNCSYYCHQATGAGLANTIGSGTATVELADLASCDLVFVIGANPASNHPRFIHKLMDCRRRNGHVVVINPAREPGLVRFAVPKSARSMLSGGSWIASHYLQPRIGSDVALLTAIGKSLLENQQIDEAFIAEYTSGFEAYCSQLKESTWSSLCEATGIAREEVEDVAQCYATSERVVFAWGMGITHHRHGVENVEAISNLALLRGMIGKRHAGLLPLRGHSNVQGIGTIGVKPVLPEEIFARLEQELDVELPEAKGLDTMACLRQAHAGKMDAALFMGGNLYEASPDSGWTRAALNRIGFKLYLTTTLNRGHVHGMDDSLHETEAMILPVTARDEEWEPTTQESMFNYVRMSDGGIRRLANPRPEVSVLCDLASRLLPDSQLDFQQFKSHRSIRQAIARIIPGMEALADIDVAKKEFHINGRLMHAPAFKTADGRASFIRHDWQALHSPDSDFPFVLMSVRSEGQFNTIIYEEGDSYRGVKSRNSLFICSEDLRRLNMSSGELVTLRSRYGQLENLALREFDLPPGNIMTYFPEANALIGRDVDPRSQTPAFKSVPVAIHVARSRRHLRESEGLHNET